MSITTKDRAKVGTTTYMVSVVKWIVDDYPTVLQSTEVPTLDEAKAWAEAHRGVCDHANIEKGTYQPDDFDDDEYGVILDASWERDEEFACYGYWADSTSPVAWDDHG
jgi:hypothetical protein